MIPGGRLYAAANRNSRACGRMVDGPDRPSRCRGCSEAERVRPMSSVESTSRPFARSAGAASALATQARGKPSLPGSQILQRSRREAALSDCSPSSCPRGPGLASARYSPRSRNGACATEDYVQQAIAAPASGCCDCGLDWPPAGDRHRISGTQELHVAQAGDVLHLLSERTGHARGAYCGHRRAAQ